MAWISCKERMPEPSKVVECHGTNCRGDYRIKLKWELYQKPIRKKLGRWMWECFPGTAVAYWTSYPQHREIIEWRELEEGSDNG
jgi:hypothetical protein